MKGESDPGRSSVLEHILDLLFPRRCVGCGRPGSVWCSSCQNQLVPIKPRCPICGGPSLRCAACALAPLPLRTHSHAFYEGPLSKAILRLKYSPDGELGQLMAGWLKEKYAQAGWAATLVVPVPLAHGRMKSRGYNQVSLISRALGIALGLPHSENALVRVRETASQVGLEPHERRQNVTGAFRASEAIVRGERILLVDDLFTTGATLSACSEAISRAGAEEVLGLTVARARSR